MRIWIGTLAYWQIGTLTIDTISAPKAPPPSLQPTLIIILILNLHRLLRQPKRPEGINHYRQLLSFFRTQTLLHRSRMRTMGYATRVKVDHATGDMLAAHKI